MKSACFILLMILFATISSPAQIPYPGKEPGKAISKTSGYSYVLENNAIRMEFRQIDNELTIHSFKDKQGQKEISIYNTPLFELMLKNGVVISSDNFELTNDPVSAQIPTNPESMIYSRKMGGTKFQADLIDHNHRIKVHWEALLYHEANYIRQEFTFATDSAISLSRISLLKLPAGNNVRKEGTVYGSPLVQDNMFFAVEHPLSQVSQSKSFMGSYLDPRYQLTSRNSISLSSVWGVVPEGQLRRGFLYYLERERSIPYHQVLHYNSWYDISWANILFNEEQAMDRIKMFRDSLIIKRGVPVQAFLLDDGWDDHKSLWRFHNGFPDGFANLLKEATSCNSTLGVWLSPFGGYGAAKANRLEYGKKQNPPFEINENGFSLQGPVYFKRFLEATSSFIKDYNVSMFKFDGVGSGARDPNGPGIEYHSDILSFLKLLKELKKMKPDVYLSLTTGTWPSVYWLMYGDNIWRFGGDNGMRGEGPRRQQWITYRDSETYRWVVDRAPLYPLNALMNGGIIIGSHGSTANHEMDEKNIADEIWSFFGTGVNLQEMYINPHKMTSGHWDCLAAASNWARQNENVLADVHWVGGDPAKGDVYGYAAWSPEKAVLTLRNPSSATRTYEISVANAFELPANEKRSYNFFDVRAGSKVPVMGGRFMKITLQPFETKVFDAYPEKSHYK